MPTSGYDPYSSLPKTSGPDIVSGLHSHTAHIWLLPLPLRPRARQQDYQLLSESEIEQATSFQLKKDKERFVLRRSNLRRLLSFYTKLPLTEIKLTTNEYGRPQLISPYKYLPDFNTSFSARFCLYSFSAGKQTGIDFEAKQPLRRIAHIANDILNPTEKLSLPNDPNRAENLIMRAWVRKEATMKALGAGLYCSPKLISVLDLRENFEQFQKVRILNQRSPDLYLIDIDLKSTGWASLAIKDKPVDEILLFRHVISNTFSMNAAIRSNNTGHDRTKNLIAQPTSRISAISTEALDLSLCLAR